MEGINNILCVSPIDFEHRPSRANMQPKISSVWFARMKGANKILLITQIDKDILSNCILSTGFLGINESNDIPLSLLLAIISTKDFLIQRDLNSVGTTMAGINNNTVLKIKVPYLNKSEIEDFDFFAHPLIDKLSSIRRQLNKLLGLKHLLLNKYF